MTAHQVLIVGGGIGGLCAALALGRAGYQVQVLEQTAEFSDIGAGIQLSPNATRVLFSLGLEVPLNEFSFVPEGVEMRGWRTGAVLNHNLLGAHAVQQFGFPYLHIHRADLLRVLHVAALECAQISLFTNTLVTSVEQTVDGVQVQAGSQSYRGDLLVGADGIHSAVRASLFGATASTFTGNIAWRALVPVDRLPEGLIRPMATAWWGPGKHFVHYFVRRGELVNCVCVVEKTGWQVESWTEPGEYQELKADFHGWHDDIQTLIDHADRDSLFKWALFDRAPMSRWSEGRATLLGDACHPTLPFMAQGAAMAIEDAAVLAACLHQGGNPTEQLQRYERLRIKRTAGVQTGSRRNGKIFHLSGIPAWFRNRALKRAAGNRMKALYSYDALAAVETH